MEKRVILIVEEAIQQATADTGDDLVNIEFVWENCKSQISRDNFNAYINSLIGVGDIKRHYCRNTEVAIIVFADYLNKS